VIANISDLPSLETANIKGSLGVLGPIFIYDDLRSWALPLALGAGWRLSVTRVLVIEDYEPFRRFVCSMLRKRPEFQVVGEVSNGLEAVQRTKELAPDLILMDIGLPGLNGMEATRQIRTLFPACKIIFLTQESSVEIVEAALGLGACGYVIKTHAENDLIPALRAACEGGRFVSSAVAGHICPDATEAPGISGVPARAAVQETHVTQGPREVQTSAGHRVQFHPDDPSFLASFVRFIENALNAGRVVIVLATEAHHTSLREKLLARGIDCAAATQNGRYIPLDVAEMLAKFMVDNLPDPARFFTTTADLVRAVRDENGDCSISACGECSPFLWAQGNGEGAVQLERLWDEVARRYDIDTFCAYVLKKTQREQTSFYDRICAAHSAVG
jgi:DNA-binding NarL/FixJ family response regulator